jgi:aminocarboxymuconate-semialdehyde decarboxylase
VSKLGRRDFITTGALAAAAGVVGAGTRQALARGTESAGHARGLGGLSYAESGPEKPWLIPQLKVSRPVTVDTHTHWAPEAYLKVKAELGHPDFLNPVNYAMDHRIKWMDELGVQTIILTLGGFMPWGWTTPEQGLRIARLVNDAAIEAHAAHPDRFLAGIEIPVGYPEGCLQELSRVGGKPGMVGVHVPNTLPDRLEYLFEPAFAPVLRRVEELGLPLLVHPLDGKQNWFAADLLADQYSGTNPNPKGPASLFPGLTNSLGETFWQATTMAKLIVTGTLDRYPNLTPLIYHAGGAFPYVAGRVEGRTWGASHLKHPFKEYLRRFYYDDLTYYPIALRFLIDLVGVDRIVVATDNMFTDFNQMLPPNTLVDQLNLPAEERDLVLFGNARRLFRI